MGWGEQVFTLLVLLVSAGVAAHITHGYGTKKSRELFASLVLGIIVGGQLYHLVHAATYIPATRYYTWNPLLHRDDCIDSGKSGKRVGNDTNTDDLNPCYCMGTLAECYTVVKNSDVTYDLTDPSVVCPIDGTAKCKQGPTRADRIHRWVPSLRDCRGGQLTQCTKDQPCTPCERDKLDLFKEGRCRSCSSENKGDCNFVPGVGPYCKVSPDSKAVEPCKQCCTEPEPYFDANGFCW